MPASARACTRLRPRNFHGKEGVDGSSPSEGLHEVPANGHFLSSDRATRGYTAGTSAVPAPYGERLSRRAAVIGARANPLKSRAGTVVSMGENVTPSLERGGR